MRKYGIKWIKPPKESDWARNHIDRMPGNINSAYRYLEKYRETHPAWEGIVVEINEEGKEIPQ